MSKVQHSSPAIKGPLLVHGRTFRSVKDAARAFGINVQTACARLQRGWPIESVFSAPPAARSRNTPVVVAGRRFTSIQAAAQHFEIALSSISLYRQRGLSTEKAIEEVLRRRETKARILANRESASSALRSAREGAGASHGLVLDPAAPLLLQGKTYPDLYVACLSFGTTCDTVRRRLRLGWSLLQALGAEPKPVRVHMIHSVTVRGVSYPSLVQAAKALNVPWATFRTRLQRGYTPEQAAGLEPCPTWCGADGKPKSIEISGRTFASKVEAARHFGVPSAIFWKRLRNSWTLEEALGLAPAPVRRKGRKPAPVSVRGVQYASLFDACAVFGLRKATAVDRIRRGWSIEKALTTAPARRENSSEGIAV